MPRDARPDEFSHFTEAQKTTLLRVRYTEKWSINEFRDLAAMVRNAPLSFMQKFRVEMGIRSNEPICHTEDDAAKLWAWFRNGQLTPRGRLKKRPRIPFDSPAHRIAAYTFQNVCIANIERSGAIVWRALGANGESFCYIRKPFGITTESGNYERIMRAVQNVVSAACFYLETQRDIGAHGTAVREVRDIARSIPPGEWQDVRREALRTIEGHRTNAGLGSHLSTAWHSARGAITSAISR